MWLAAVVAVILVGAGVLVLALPSKNAVIAQELPPTTSSTTSSTSTSTTSTTVKRTTTTTTTPPTTRPPTTRVTTTRPPATAAPATTRKAATQQPVALPTNNTPAERCANARQWVAEHGLTLPAGWGFRCPGTALVAGELRWGVACWNCEGNGSSWIAVDIGRIGSSDKALRYVIAHETCHAIDYMTLGLTTELQADLCAALHGAPR
jgi:hypothetical protein